MEDFVAFCRARMAGFDTIGLNRKGNYVFRLQYFGNIAFMGRAKTHFRDHIKTRLDRFDIPYRIVAFGYKQVSLFNAKANVKDSSHYWVEIKLKS